MRGGYVVPDMPADKVPHYNLHSLVGVGKVRCKRSGKCVMMEFTQSMPWGGACQYDGWGPDIVFFDSPNSHCWPPSRKSTGRGMELEKEYFLDYWVSHSIDGMRKED